LLLTDPANTLPVGGTTGQVLGKTSNTDFAVGWINGTIPTGGTTGQMLVKTSNSDYVTGWSNPVRKLQDLTDTSIQLTPTDGDVLTWSGTNQEWENQPGAARGTVSFQNGGTTYNPQPGDAFTMQLFTFTGPVAVQIQLDSAAFFPKDSEVTLCADAAGCIVTVTASTGVILEKPDGYSTSLLGRGAVATIKKVDVNRWKLYGLLSPDS
jgi:hypothetical protein